MKVLVTSCVLAASTLLSACDPAARCANDRLRHRAIGRWMFVTGCGVGSLFLKVEFAMARTLHVNR